MVHNHPAPVDVEAEDVATGRRGVRLDLVAVRPSPHARGGTEGPRVAEAELELTSAEGPCILHAGGCNFADMLVV
ncbi:hypothetical protein GCM10009627_15520 [Curtobacterium herbarum]|uniref:Uncharacterized protein n=1 Tax=Curtobacterium herbarum TaxID=150122 RepID=A0ABP4K2X1_9MICO